MVNERGDRGSGLDARYEALRHAALHARAEAFPSASPCSPGGA